VHTSSAPVLAYAVTQCSSFITSRGLSFSLLIGADWVYLWPRVSSAAQEEAPPATPAAAGAESLAGVLKVESAQALASLTAEGAAANLAKNSPSATELKLIFAHCAGAS
jgi:hypothetical protein